MKPIYFPFTWISDSVAQALIDCFGRFTLFQPVAGKMPERIQAWVEKGVLELRVPVAGDKAQMDATMKDYLSWADLHSGGSGLKHFQRYKEASPYFSATSASQLMTDIKRRTDARSKAFPGPSKPDAAARIFLYFAQEFDRQNYEVAQGLTQSSQREAELIRELRMDHEPVTAEFGKEKTKIPDDPAGFMIADRMEAWVRVFLEDCGLSGIFVTHLPGALQELLDKTPSVQKLCHFKSIPTGQPLSTIADSWRQMLLSDLSRIVATDWNQATTEPLSPPDQAPAGSSVSLSLYLVPNESPRDYFPRCFRIEPSDGDACQSAGDLKNTVLGLIECG